MQVVTIVRDVWKENDKQLLTVLTNLSVKVSKLEVEVYKQSKLLEPTGHYDSGIKPALRPDFESNFELRQREAVENANDQ